MEDINILTQIGRHFADDIKRVSLKEDCCISMQVSLKFVPRALSAINNYFFNARFDAKQTADHYQLRGKCVHAMTSSYAWTISSVIDSHFCSGIVVINTGCRAYLECHEHLHCLLELSTRFVLYLNILRFLRCFWLFHIVMPYNIIFYFRLFYFHVSNCALFST